MTVGVEHIDKAVARTGHIVVLLGVLLCICDEEIAVDVLDAERRETGRDVRIGEAPVGRYRYVWPLLLELAGPNTSTVPARKLVAKRKTPFALTPKHEALVNRTRRVIDREDCLIRRGQPAGPSRKSSVLGVPDKRRQRLVPGTRKRRAASRVPHKAGRRCRRRVGRIVRVGMLAGGGGHTASGQRELHLQRLDRPLPIVKRRTPRGIVGNPEGTGIWRKSDAPGILQDRVGVRRYARNVGGQVRDHIPIWPNEPIRSIVGANGRGCTETDCDERDRTRDLD